MTPQRGRVEQKELARCQLTDLPNGYPADRADWRCGGAMSKSPPFKYPLSRGLLVCIVSLVGNQTVNLMRQEPLATVEKCEFDQKRKAEYFRMLLFGQSQAGFHGSPGRQQVVHEQNSIAR